MRTRLFKKLTDRPKAKSQRVGESLERPQVKGILRLIQAPLSQHTFLPQRAGGTKGNTSDSL